MTKPKTLLNQNGFALAEVIIASVLAVLIAGVGVYVYTSNLQASKARKANEIAIADEAKKLADQESIKYLKIKEWNIKLPLTDKKLSGLKYEILPEKMQEKGDIIKVTAPYISKLQMTCQGATKPVSPQSIFRFTDKEDAVNSTVMKDDGVKKVGKYYFAFSKRVGTGDCDVSVSDWYVVKDFEKTLLDAFNNIEATPIVKEKNKQTN